MAVEILVGHVLERLRDMPDASQHCAVTSPPYYGLRDYKTEPQIWDGDPACAHEFEMELVEAELCKGVGMVELNKRYRGGGKKIGLVPNIKAERGFCKLCGAWKGHLGLEPTVQLYVEHMVDIFRDVRRVLRHDGVLWLNLGDSYCSSGGTGHQGKLGDRATRSHTQRSLLGRTTNNPGIKSKDLMALPWRVAIALQEDGWYLRSALPWVKRNCLPESTEDRPTSAIEYVFLLAKSEIYYYDEFAVRRQASPDTHARIARGGRGSARANGGTRPDRPMKATIRRPKLAHPKSGIRSNSDFEEATSGGVLLDRNFRNSDLFFDSLKAPYGLISGADGVPIALDVTPKAFKEAHFATFPPDLVVPLIAAGTSEAGCCSSCGAPRVRLVEKVGGTKGKGSWHEHEADATEGHTGGIDVREGLVDYEVRSIGWTSSCACRSPVVPCRVLDPFGGSGTTALVAARMGRDATLIELSAQYVQMADGRLRGKMIKVKGEPANQHNALPLFSLGVAE